MLLKSTKKFEHTHIKRNLITKFYFELIYWNFNNDNKRVKNKIENIFFSPLNMYLGNTYLKYHFANKLILVLCPQDEGKRFLCRHKKK